MKPMFSIDGICRVLKIHTQRSREVMIDIKDGCLVVYSFNEKGEKIRTVLTPVASTGVDMYAPLQMKRPNLMNKIINMLPLKG